MFGLSQNCLEYFTKKALNLYHVSSTKLTQPYPGVVESLYYLKKSNFKLGVCTNKPHLTTLKILDDLKLMKFFDAVVAGDTLKVKKPNPRVLRHCLDKMKSPKAVFIGDSEVDYLTAKRANMPFILFANGYRKSPLTFFKNIQVFYDFNQLGAVLEKHIFN